MLRGCRKSFKRGRTEAQHQSNNKRDRQRRNDVIFTSTVQLMLEDMVWTKANAFQGKRKMKCQWDGVEYKIACQVANGLPSYETKDLSHKAKTPHHDRLFLVATPQGAPTSLCQNEYANVNPTNRSVLAESTPQECDIDLPRNTVKEQPSRCSTSFSPFGQVDGI